MTPRSRAPGTIARGLAALVALVILVAGLPVLLYRLGGNPLPRHLDGWHQLGSALWRPDNGTIFLAAVRDVSWLAWAAFTAAVAAEVQAVVRRRSAPRLRLGGLQHTAGWLVALTALMFTAPAGQLLAGHATAPAATAPGPAAAPAPALAAAAFGRPAPRGPAAGPDARPGSVSATAQVTSMGSYQLVTVHPGDCLWTLAQRYLGDGDKYPEIASLNLGRRMDDGRTFSDPSLIYAGWVLRVPASGAAVPDAGPHPAGLHAGHQSASTPFRQVHRGADHHAQSGPAPDGSATGAPAPDGSATGAPTRAAAPSAAAQGASAGPAMTAAGNSSPAAPSQIPPVAVFAAGMLAGGAVVTLGRMRHRQRQARRPGRRIPLPASAPVQLAEQRLRAAAPPAGPAVQSADRRLHTAAPQPATALRAALADLGADLAATGRLLPEFLGIRLLPSSMDVLLASPASEPPPIPFTVPGGRQGMVWRYPLPDAQPPIASATLDSGDLLPGLVTAGMAPGGGYLLLDLEQLRVTAVAGPADLADAVLTTAAAELATTELAGWYQLILVGFPELDGIGGRATCCADLDDALDLLAAKAVTVRRRLGDVPPGAVRYQRLTEPGDEDWALALLVSRVAPTTGQLAMLSDLASGPGSIGALLAAGHEATERQPAPAVIELTADDDQPGGMTARLWPQDLDFWPQPLSAIDYEALTSLFARAAELADVAADDLPYDRRSWPAELAEPSPDWADEADHRTSGWAADAGAAAPGWPGDPGDGDAAWAAGPDNDTAALSADPGNGDAAWPAGPDNDTAALSADPVRPAAGWPAAAIQPAWAADTEQRAAPWPAGAEYHTAERAADAVAEPDSILADIPDEPGRTGAARPVTPGGELERATVLPEPPPTAQVAHAAAATLRIGVLGTFTINGAPAALLPAQSQLVLALAVHGPESLSNGQLCYLLGADPDHPKPTDSLRQLIVRTRRQLGTAPDGREWIEHLGGGQYALHPAARFDWAEFEARSEQGISGRDVGPLRDALSLIRGQPFTGCYHWWLDLAFTETVRAQIVDTADMLAAVELAAGDPAASARAARIGLAADPAAEQLWRALMRAEHGAGNSTGVREAWSHCLDAIADVAPDGEPHPDTAGLYDALISRQQQRSAWLPR